MDSNDLLKMSQRHSTCPICNQGTPSRFLDNQIFTCNAEETPWSFRYSIDCCKQCGVGFMNPMPESQLSNYFYQDDYNCYVKPNIYVEQLKSQPVKFTTARWMAGSNPVLRAITTLAALLVGRRYTYTLSQPLAMDHSIRFLDFGCGAGAYLLLLRELGFSNLHGWDIASNTQVLELLEQAKIKMLPLDFTDTGFMAGEFDLIRMEHVLEHSNDPESLLTILRSKLSKDGEIVCTVPDFESWCIALDPISCPLLHLPYHTWHFTSKSLRIICQKAGLDIVKEIKIPVYAQYQQSLAKNENNPALKALTRISGKLGQPLYSLISDFKGNGDFLSVVLRKV